MRIWRHNRNRLQQLESGAPVLIVSDSDVTALLNQYGSFSAELQQQHNCEMEDQAYIQRNHQASIVRFFASLPLSERFQTNMKTLLAFLTKEVERYVPKDMDFYNEPTRNTLDIPQYESAIKDEDKKLSYSTCNIYVGANYVYQDKGYDKAQVVNLCPHFMYKHRRHCLLHVNNSEFL
ncbi:hypothetical protein PS15p_203006 [Mucor circinelloides]